MSTVLENIEAGFTGAADRLKTAAAQFQNIYAQFIAIPVKYRSNNWQSIYNQATTVRNTISAFTGAIDTAYNWLRSAFGLQGLGQLGIIVPAVPWLSVAAVGAAVTAIMAVIPYMVREVNEASYRAELDAINIERIKAGEKPLDYYKPDSPTIFGDVKDLAKWVIIGGAALFIVPKILEKWKGK